MKLCNKERRLLNRRLKQRISPISWASFRKYPSLVVLAAATIWITPEALAQVKAKEAEVVLVDMRQELAKKEPENPVPGLDKILKTEVVELFKNITNSQTTNNTNAREILKISNAAPIPTTNDFSLRIATLQDGPPKSPNLRNSIGNYVGSESERIASNRVKSKSAILQKFKTGLNFNLDLNTLFNKSEPPKQGTIRYGLMVKDIIPDKKSSAQAAVDNTTDELTHAGQAEVVWTIGPVNDDPSHKIFNVPESTNEKQPSIVDNLKIPKAKFKGNVVTVNDPNFFTAEKEGFPGLLFTMTQEEGYYQFLYQTKGNLEKSNAEHKFMVPVYQNLSLGRRFNDNWQLLETSVNNLLIDKRAPVVNIQYLHIEEMYIASVTKDTENTSVSFAALTNPKRNLEKSPLKDKKNYNLDFTFKF